MGRHRPARAGRGVRRHRDDHVPLARRGHQGQRLLRAAAVRDPAAKALSRAGAGGAMTRRPAATRSRARPGGALDPPRPRARRRARRPPRSRRAALALGGGASGAGARPRRARARPEPVPSPRRRPRPRVLQREYIAAVRGRDDRGRGPPMPRSPGRRGVARTNCHGIMHAVGRTYAREAAPDARRPHAPSAAGQRSRLRAGFAHGLVTGVAPDIDAAPPGEAAGSAAARARATRRTATSTASATRSSASTGTGSGPAEACRALGPRAAATARGAYHDYWFAASGADEATLPARPCATRRGYVRGRGELRAAMLVPGLIQNRPVAFAVEARRTSTRCANGSRSYTRPASPPRR